MSEYSKVTPEIVEQIKAVVAPNRVYTGADINEDFSHDEMSIYGKAMPELVVDAVSTEEIAATMKIAYDNNIPVTARGAGTGLVGACVPIAGGIVINTTKMNKILEYDLNNFVVKVQCGVLLNDLAEDCVSKGLMYPPDPGEKFATLGGNVSTNAGGMRACKYGATRDYVRAMEVVLPTGEVTRFGSTVSKTSSGYSLLNLMIGSEGTLAVVLEATLKLYPRLEYTGALVCSFNTTEDAVKSVGEVQKAGIIPLAVEYMDRAISVGTAEHIERTWPMKDEGKVDLLYLVEEATEDALYETAGTIAEICENNGAVGSVIAEDSKQQRNLLDIRSAIYEVYKPVFVDSLDTAVPVANIGDLLKEFDAIAEKYGTTTPRFGHVADGNFHNFILMVDGKVPEWADDMRRDIYKAAIKYGGTITAEHGTGKTRKPYMNLQYTPHVLGIMKSIKKAFDPNNILNPGVIIDLDD